jgi:hypothetical protein
MNFPEHLARYQMPTAIASLARRLGLRHEPHMQDWAWEVAEPTRLDEFLESYEQADLTEDERFVLMEILIQCCEDLPGDLNEDPRWNRVLRLLDENVSLHMASVYYWTQPQFRVAAGVGRVLDPHRRDFRAP